MIELSNGEQQVLGACVRASLDARSGRDSSTHLAQLIGEIEDWSLLVQTAKEHGMFGLLWYCSKLVHPDVFPADIQYALDRFIDSQRAQNVLRADKLLEVLEALAKAGIRAAPFKGPLLAESAYGDIGLRTFWDLDFLVPEPDFVQALGVLDTLGFRNGSQSLVDYEYSSRELLAWWRYWGQAVYYRDADELYLEPHLAIAPVTLALDFDGLWERATLGEWREQQIWRFEPEDELLILCLQGAKPYWDNLKLPADLAHFVVNHPDLDWDKVVDRARACGFLRLLALAMLLAERLFALSLPDVPRKFAYADRQAASMCESLLHQENAFVYEATEVHKVSRYYLDLRERPRDKLKCLWRTLIRPRGAHFELVRLPDSLFWAYSLVKIVSDTFSGIKAYLRRFL